MTADKADVERQIVEGWQGRYYEDFEVGEIYKHPYGRTVTPTDNVWLTNIAMAPNAIHFNQVYASENELDVEDSREDSRIVNGIFVIMLSVGMSVMDVSQNAAANLGYDDVRHHAPVYHGDTIFAESEVLSKRESDSRPNVGLVTTELRAYNQNDDLVLSLERTPMVYKREYAQPDAATPTGWVEGIGTQPEDL